LIRRHDQPEIARHRQQEKSEEMSLPSVSLQICLREQRRAKPQYSSQQQKDLSDGVQCQYSAEQQPKHLVRRA